LIDRTPVRHAIDRYTYTARLDERHVITVTSSENPKNSQAASEKAQQMLADAIDTVREQR
jgi:hypothetical protein